MDQMKYFILIIWTKWKTLFLPIEPNELLYSQQMNQMKDFILNKWTKWKLKSHQRTKRKTILNK